MKRCHVLPPAETRNARLRGTVANEDLVPAEERNHAKFCGRLARKFGQTVHKDKWGAAIDLGHRTKKTSETYEEYATALEHLVGTQTVEHSFVVR